MSSGTSKVTLKERAKQSYKCRLFKGSKEQSYGHTSINILDILALTKCAVYSLEPVFLFAAISSPSPCSSETSESCRRETGGFTPHWVCLVKVLL